MAVLAAKALATLATAGSGAVGGVFTPALFFGCMVSALFGNGVHSAFPGATAQPFAYAIVGMGAFLAGATQAPLMAILMIFEMTLSDQVMLPLMAASLVAYFVARSANSGSMYEITLIRRHQQNERLRLRTLHVRDLTEPAQTVVLPTAVLAEMGTLFPQFPVKYPYLVDVAGLYLGVVPLKALTAATGKTDLSARRTADLIAQDISPIFADMDLGQALQRIMEQRGERLPVIESQAELVLLGVLAKSRLLATYVRLSE